MIREIKPQDGYQLNALSNSADIVIGGSAAGVGKTFSLLLEPLKHITRVSGFGGVIFRRTTPQIRNEGGLWDTSLKLYNEINGFTPRESSLEWCYKINKTTNKLKFAHLEYEKNIYDWQGSQIPFIGFDELTHFSEKMFFYLMSRNRSACGVKPYIRATCNPEPESWVAELIKWWLDEDGNVIKSRDSKLRYFIKNGNDYIWGDSYNEVYEKSKYFLDAIIANSDLEPTDFIKSLSFVSGDIYQNKELLKVNPQYLGNLMALNEDEKNKLLFGNWKVSTDENQLFKYAEFQGMFNNSYVCDGQNKCIAADIAGSGSNKMTVGYFDGNSLEDLAILDRCNGKEAVDCIKDMQKKYKVPNNKTIYDADGVGSYVNGFIVGAIPFNGNGAVIEIIDPISKKKIKENYFNLKTQLYYHLAADINEQNFTVSKRVAEMMYSDKETVKQRLNKERKAIKKINDNADGKIKINSKDEQKTILGGSSPDLLDMIMMKKKFDIDIKTKRPMQRVL